MDFNEDSKKTPSKKMTSSDRPLTSIFVPAPQHLGAAVLLVAILGGYQNRKHDPPPGHQIMWRGYERISIATLGYRLAEKRREGAGIV